MKSCFYFCNACTSNIYIWNMGVHTGLTITTLDVRFRTYSTECRNVNVKTKIWSRTYGLKIVFRCSAHLIEERVLMLFTSGFFKSTRHFWINWNSVLNRVENIVRDRTKIAQCRLYSPALLGKRSSHSINRTYRNLEQISVNLNRWLISWRRATWIWTRNWCKHGISTIGRTKRPSHTWTYSSTKHSRWAYSSWPITTPCRCMIIQDLEFWKFYRGRRASRVIHLSMRLTQRIWRDRMLCMLSRSQYGTSVRRTRVRCWRQQKETYMRLRRLVLSRPPFSTYLVRHTTRHRCRRNVPFSRTSPWRIVLLMASHPRPWTVIGTVVRLNHQQSRYLYPMLVCRHAVLRCIIIATPWNIILQNF